MTLRKELGLKGKPVPKAAEEAASDDEGSDAEPDTEEVLPLMLSVAIWGMMLSASFGADAWVHNRGQTGMEPRCSYRWPTRRSAHRFAGCIWSAAPNTFQSFCKSISKQVKLHAVGVTVKLADDKRFLTMGGSCRLQSRRLHQQHAASARPWFKQLSCKPDYARLAGMCFSTKELNQAIAGARPIKHYMRQRQGETLQHIQSPHGLGMVGSISGFSKLFVDSMTAMWQPAGWCGCPAQTLLAKISTHMLITTTKHRTCNAHAVHLHLTTKCSSAH